MEQINLPTSFQKNEPEKKSDSSNYWKGKTAYMVIEGAKQNVLWELTSCNKSDQDKMKEELPYTEKDDEITFSIPLECAVYARSSKTVLLCAYHAAEDYLKSLLGMSLHSSDKTWFQEHPVTVASGLPMEHTLTVLNDLVRPYNLGISRVYVRKNISLNDEQKEWQEILGVNPKALIDRDCSNAEYLKMMGSNDESQKDKWGFEFTDELPGPAIVFYSVSATTSYATGGGHASYSAPRSSKSNWALAIQLDRLPYCNRFKEAAPMEYEAVTEMKLSWLECKVPNSDKIIRNIIFPSSIGYNNGYRGGNSGYGGGGYNSPSPKETKITRQYTSKTDGTFDGSDLNSSDLKKLEKMGVTPSSKEGPFHKLFTKGTPQYKVFKQFLYKFYNTNINRVPGNDREFVPKEVDYILEDIHQAFANFVNSDIKLDDIDINRLDDLVDPKLADALRDYESVILQHASFEWSKIEMYYLWVQMRLSGNSMMSQLAGYTVRRLK
jgi:hypothetical protein